MLNLSNIKAIIFDFDETLYSNGDWTFSNEHFCKPLVRLGIYGSISEAVENVCGMYPEIKDFYKKVIQIFKDNGLSSQKYRAMLEEEIVFDMKSDALRKMDYSLLDELSKHYKLYLISDSPKIYIDYYLDDFNINKNNFEEIIINPFLDEDISKFLSMKKIVDYEKLNLDEVLMIGDSYVADIEPANKLGINSICVKNVEETESLVRKLIEQKINNSGGE